MLEADNLVVDRIYAGPQVPHAGADPLPALIGVDVGAGFRHLGPRPGADTLRLLALVTNLREPDWPDEIDYETGLLTYYGDNREARALHDTPRQGNLILRNLFDAAHDPAWTIHFPAVFVFGEAGQFRSKRFLGLAVPGAAGLGSDEDLVAIWRTKGTPAVRFQNYRAKFTILDIPVVTRAWISDIQSGVVADSTHAPKAWLDWLYGRKHKPLAAPTTIAIRTKEQQLPSTPEDEQILDVVYQAFRQEPHSFEQCAAEIARLMLPQICSYELTRPSRDGGRDAIGTYGIGTSVSGIRVDFALEAKCYGPSHGVGVKELSRLISRLRIRQFGVLVTTSYLNSQAYSELKDDGHPIVVISGGDIAGLLSKRVGDLSAIRRWLAASRHH